jgi:uncharacterized membrane protein
MAMLNNQRVSIFLHQLTPWHSMVACIGSALGSPNLAVNHAWQHSGAVLKEKWN